MSLGFFAESYGRKGQRKSWKSVWLRAGPQELFWSACLSWGMIAKYIPAIWRKNTILGMDEKQAFL